jgi:cytochrome c biogenesis protein CcmG, thiol:disulfide interchange protein DsbE
VRSTTRRWAVAGLALALMQLAPRAGRRPPLSATLLDGRAFSLQQNAGKVLIVNFWATWCAPCREELPALEAFRLKYRERGLEVLAISLDEPRNLAAVRAALQPYAFAAALSSQAAYEGYGRIWRLPTTFVIDRDGRLRADLAPGAKPLDAAWLERHVAPLLGS